MSAPTDEVRIHRDGPRVDVVFDRPHRHNAFTVGMYAALADLCRSLVDDERARVLVLSGAGGRAFAAGNDIGDFVDMADGASAVEHEAMVQDTLRALGIAAQPGRSLLSLVFEERYRPFFPQWEPWARYVLAQFKRDSLPLSRTPVHAALLAELRALPDFPRLWRHVSPAAADAPLMPVVYRPPGQPPLTFTLTRVQFVGTPELWGIVFLSVGPAIASGPAR